MLALVAIAAGWSGTAAQAAPGNFITLTGMSGAVQTGRPATISRVFAQGEIAGYARPQIVGTALAAWQCDAMNRWPDGSLRHALVSFRTTIPATGSVTVDFVNSTTPSSAGSALTQQQMLSFDTGSGPGSWGAAIELTSGSKLTASVRDMLAAGAWRYWLKGPVVTQVIVEDRSPALAWDLGWDASKPLHPVFVLTFYPGWNGVRIEYILENVWTTKYRDVSYSVALKSGPSSGATRYSRDTFNHYARSRWRKDYWDGAAPGAMRIDYNLPYLIHSRALPNYDTSNILSASAITGEINGFLAGDRGAHFGGSAQFMKYFPTTGGRGDIGYTPRWNVRYLFSFDPGLYDVMLGNGAVSAHVPIHLRESRNDASKKYCATSCTAANATAEAFGRTLSIDARPTVWASRTDYQWTSAADRFQGGGASSSGGWEVDEAHQADFAYIPYLITGDWYFLEELYFWSSFNLADSNPDAIAYGRHGNWGYLNSIGIQDRGMAWTLRTLANTAFAAPDGSPEKEYFVNKLRNNMAIAEGRYRITDGAFPPANPACPGYDQNSTRDMWCWGFKSVNGGASNPLFFVSYRSDDSRFDASSGPGMDASIAQWTAQNWQHNFIRMVLGRVREMGYAEAKGVQEALSRNLIHMLTDPAYRPWVSNAYVTPITSRATKTYFQTWSEALTGWGAPARNATWWYNTEDSLADVEHGYTHIQRAAASYLPGISDGSLTGQKAWDWINDPARNVSTQPALRDNPKWAILPRNYTAIAAGKCDINADGILNVADHAGAVNQAVGLEACGRAEIDGNGRCDVVDVQRVANAIGGGVCRAGTE